MLSKLVKEHQVKQTKTRDEIEQKKKIATKSVGNFTNELLDTVNSGVAQVFVNQQRLESETQQLQQQTKRFAKQTNQWISMIDNFNAALKEIGDVENWAKTIENDMKGIATALEYVQKQ
eukprot:CAMPEP_0168557000 /NCGR_PEP_ID=MMETSP0413-20121227/9184_1 /TAXON_ID=136452 /ORGANISM="Filamoeba nolandi, Strain NC-AS-23-1" /LENGTH=118 /DNA_ID=CAMNT_0008587987 /DNA_START=26 /DNA_END=382 /DNA_ORIENTATION=-